MCITYTKVVWRIILVDAAVSWEENKDLIIGKITDSKDKNNNTRTFSGFWKLNVDYSYKDLIGSLITCKVIKTILKTYRCVGQYNICYY